MGGLTSEDRADERAGMQLDILRTIQEELRSVQNEVAKLAHLPGEFNAIAKEVSQLSSILRGSNGKDSMVTRLALMEERVKDATTTLQELKQIQALRNIEDGRGRVTFVNTGLAAGFTLVVGFILAVVTALVNYLTKGNH